MGDLAFPMQYRSLVSGMCKVQSCMSRLACFHERFATSAGKAGEGRCASMCVILLNCRDFFQSFTACFFRHWWYVCLIADLLHGNSLHGGAGSLLFGLEPCFTACFASTSASSLPSISVCPGVHTTVRNKSLCCPVTIVRCL